MSGLRDFDFLVGDWRVQHRRLKERLARARVAGLQRHVWQGADGRLGNVDDNVIELPGDSYRGIGLRSYDSKTGQWAIWWVDARTPHGASIRR